ncbi:MAG: GNAT family protein [Ilumatobacteraceae bacterium]
MREPLILGFVLDRAIVGPRVTLRAIAEDDFEDIHSYMGRDDVAMYLLEDAYSIEESRSSQTHYTRLIRLAADDDLILLAIEVDGEVIGHLDCRAVSMLDGLVEIGWRMHPDHHGKGFAAEAAGLLLDLAFGSIGARRAVAHLDPRNDASVHLCERLGMRHEAHHVLDMWFKGEWADTGTYAILATEWAARR